VLRKVEESLPAADSDGEWKLSDGTYTKNRQQRVDDGLNKALRYHQNVCDFLQACDLADFPGTSPLEQAMSLLKLLSKQQGGSGGGEGGEPLPVFTDSDNPEAVAEQLSQIMDEVDSLDQTEREMLDPDGKWFESDSQDQGGQELNKLKVAEDLTPGTDKRAMLDISRTLDQFTKLQVRKSVHEEQDPAGEEVRNRPIRNLSELSKVSKTAWATRQQNPSYFLYQAVTGQLPVRERVTRLERKQAIFILLDGSGSMKGKKHWKATGVVMNRLKAVISGDAVVYLSVFDTEMSEPRVASTPEEAKALIKDFAAGNFKGGGTDIKAAVKAAHAFIETEIKSGAALYRPEVVVLTDEDNSIVGLKKADIPSTRVHGFAMEVANKSLVEFARSTGGVGIDKL
jgi:Mg-chelatase subunit ChlD